jgi:hypothetical protein
MDDMLKGQTKIRNSFIVFSVLGLIIGALLIFYWVYDISDQKLLAVISGLLTGFVVALFQTLLSLKALQKLDKYDNFKIIEILPRKNDRQYYKSLLAKAKRKIRLQGSTAQRFLHHFANKEDSEEGADILLSALCKGVEVRILVASKDKLNEREKRKAEMAEDRLNELSEKFKDQFKFAYYEHEPTHSIFIVDRECIVGPMFTELSSSEHTPAIHLKNNSEFAENYLKYFNSEWKKWSKDHEELQD